MTKIVLLGGPTGVGKTTALKVLEKSLPRCGLLDADDVWRISQDLAVDGTRSIALSNVIGVMRGYVQAQCEVAILSWVFARPQLFQPVIDGLSGSVDSIHQLYSIATPDALRQRLAQRQDSHRFDYSLSRLELIDQLSYPKIDTTLLSPEEVAGEVVAYINGLTN